MVGTYGSGRKAEASKMQCLALMCNRVDGPSRPMSAVVLHCASGLELSNQGQRSCGVAVHAA